VRFDEARLGRGVGQRRSGQRGKQVVARRLFEQHRGIAAAGRCDARGEGRPDAPILVLVQTNSGLTTSVRNDQACRRGRAIGRSGHDLPVADDEHLAVALDADKRAERFDEM
jgi:hypothetical protein